jgi:hypothetical protein
VEIAYIISAYKYPEQLIRLVRRLNAEGASFFIHIDKKARPGMYEQVFQSLKAAPGVHFLKRYRCEWGGFGHVLASLEGIEELYRKKISFDYAILLTGQDYPIRSNDQIKKFFSQNEGMSFLDFFPLPSSQWQDGGLDRIERWHFRFRNRHFVFPKGPNRLLQRKFLQGYRPYGGSSYWCLSNNCVRLVYEHINCHPEFVSFFRTIDVPDELFFQTLLLNSRVREKIVNDDLRFIEWRDLESGSPAILTTSDFEKMIQSPKLFARKFDITVDADILDRIDHAIENNGVVI